MLDISLLCHKKFLKVIISKNDSDFLVVGRAVSLLGILIKAHCPFAGVAVFLRLSFLYRKRIWFYGAIGNLCFNIDRGQWKDKRHCFNWDFHNALCSLDDTVSPGDYWWGWNMNMHELESHPEADKGYCPSPGSAWY